MKLLANTILLFYVLDCYSQTIIKTNLTDSINTIKKHSENNSTLNKAPIDLFTNEQKIITPELKALVDKITNSKLPFSFSGLIDAYYFKNLNNPKNSSNTGISNAARAFDQKENQFQIGMAQTKFSWSKKRVDAVIDLTFGPNADLANYGNKIGPHGSNVGSSAIAIKQAYISYKLNNKNIFTIGQFGTHIGYEVIESSINYNYSLSNLFNNGPFYHQGLKYTHTFNDKFSIMTGVVNNWDNLYDNNRFKTAIASICLTPKAGYSFSLNYIGGNEDDLFDSLKNASYYETQTISCYKQLLDFVANMQLTKKIFVGFNIAVGDKNNQTVLIDSTSTKLESKNWGGAAMYLNYAITSKIGLGLRGELFDNTSGVQYIGNTDVQSYTATFKINLDDDLLIKPEFRMDIYKWNRDTNGLPVFQQFMDHSGNYNKNSQITIGIAAIYKF